MVSHFSVFVAMGAPGDSSNAVVYPSPFKPGSGGDFDALYITFDNLSPKASIKIYNIAGQLVKELSNTEEESYITWDITLNDSGDKAASGVYFFAVRDEDGKTTTGKFSIIK